MGFEKLQLNRKTAKGPLAMAGVSFSGVKEETNEAWLCHGAIEGEVFQVKHNHKLALPAISAELSKIENLTNLALACPFSLPLDFLQFLGVKDEGFKYDQWQQIAEKLVFTAQEDYHQLIEAYHKDAKRLTDKQVNPQAASPVHRGSPAMWLVTYHGIRFLAMLDPSKYNILPFADKLEEHCSVIEVNPRAVLKNFGLPDTGYRSREKKDRDQMHSTRHKMLKALIGAKDELLRAGKSKAKLIPGLSVSAKVEHAVVESELALDALLAAYTAAIFETSANIFSDPFATDNMDIFIEGWIYSPEFN